MKFVDININIKDILIVGCGGCLKFCVERVFEFLWYYGCFWIIF